MFSPMGQTNPENFGNGGTIDGDLVVSGDLQVSGGGSLSFDEIIEGTSQVKVTNTSAFLVEKADGTDVLIVDTTNSRVGVGGSPSRRLESINTNAGADTLLLQLRNNSSNASTSSSLRFVNSTSGTSSAGGAEISAIRNSNDGGSLTIKTAQDSSATLTTALTIDSSQNVGIGSSAPDAWSYSTKVLTLSGGTTANNYVAFNLGAYSTSTTGIIGDINFTQFASDGTTGAERAIIRGLNDGATDSVALKFYTTATGGAVTERLKISSTGSTTIYGNQFIEGTDAFLQFHDTGETTHSGSGVHTILSADDKLKFMGRENDASAHVDGFSLLRTGDVQFHKTITIDSNATDGTALTIDSEAQDGQGIYMDVSQQTTGYGININDVGSSRTTGGIIYINSNQNNGGTRNLVHIINEHANATGTTALFVKQDAAQEAVKIDQNGNGDGLLIATDATTRHGLYVDGSAFTTGNGAYIYSNASNDSTRNVMLIVNDHTGAIGATGLKIQQDSTAPAMHINAGGNDVMKVDSNSRISLSNNGGGSNTTFGYLALNSATANVANNIAIGHETLKAMDGTETGNVALGYQAMLSVDENINSGGGTNSANYNVAVGYQALTGGQFSDGNNSDNKDFTGNIAIGAFALNSTGTNAVTGAVAIGQSSLTAMTSGANNTAVGYISGASVSTGSGNTFIGDRAGDATDDGNSNTAVGYLSLSANCANYNVAVGAESLKVATGSYNTAVGFESQLAITDSERNTSLGYQSLKTASTGDSNNTAIGYASLQISTTEGNTSVGSSSSQFIDTGENNTALGYGAMTSSGSGNDASLNVAVGYLAFNGATDGDQNTIIGASANPSAGTGSNQTVIGYNATGVANNSVTLGNASVTDVYMSQDAGATVHGAKPQWADATSKYYKLIGTKSLSADTLTDLFTVGHSHSYNITFWADSGNDGVSGFHRTAAIYGSSNTSEVHETTYGSGTDNITIVYNNSGYKIQVNAATANCTFHYIIEGFGSQTLTAL
jgi:hypothetical protein